MRSNPKKNWVSHTRVHTERLLSPQGEISIIEKDDSCQASKTSNGRDMETRTEGPQNLLKDDNFQMTPKESLRPFATVASVIDRHGIISANAQRAFWDTQKFLRVCMQTENAHGYRTYPLSEFEFHLFDVCVLPP